MRQCPCCGHELTADMLLPKAPQLSPLQRRILERVRLSRQGGVSMAGLIDAVYPYGSGPDCPDVTLRTHIWFLNQKLKPLGLQVRGGWSRGNLYRLESISS